jgi:hypothetical protein
MILIDDILISDEVVDKHFVCNLKACKGACCVEGDSGAPLEQEEVTLLERDFAAIKHFLTPEGITAIEQQGVSVEEKDDEYTGLATPLIDGKACAYVTYDDQGVTSCGIEQAYLSGAINWKKPLSCHLYPLRIKNYDTVVAVNFDDWEICDPACKLGKELQVPVYQFVKEALIRKFGPEFYEVLEQAASDHNNA